MSRPERTGAERRGELSRRPREVMIVERECVVWLAVYGCVRLPSTGVVGSRGCRTTEVTRAATNSRRRTGRLIRNTRRWHARGEAVYGGEAGGDELVEPFVEGGDERATLTVEG